MSKKAAYIKRTMIQNANVSGLTVQQHTALSILCRYRHNFHSNTEAITCGLEKGQKLENFFRKSMPIMLRSANLPGLDVSEELDALADALTRKDKYTATTQLALLEMINLKIENFLREIDFRNGTSYAPSGYARFARQERLSFHSGNEAA